MARRSRLFSLSALTRAYQRNLKAFARAARPVRAKAPAAPRRVVPAPAVPARRAASKPVPARGEWVGGVAPGPAGARRYHLYIPPGLALKADEKLPLLVMLHGCGQTGGDLAAATRMNRLAARERFLVLYPEQERMANAHGCWNWFERRNGKAQAEAATLLAAVDKVARRYPVDLARVAVAGLSAGASMAVLMAALYPQRFCAVAMHSGVAPGTAESAATALAAMHGRRAAHLPEPLGVSLNQGATPSVLPLPPLLVLHGDADGVVSVRNAAATALLWADALGARAGALRTLQRGQRHAMRVTEFKTRGRTVVALREVAGLAHAWSGGVAQLPFSDPAGPDASALVWAFVARQFAKK
ncbi:MULTISPECIES: PHB depolymerase family esterase [Acidovorax]|mgnify:FL=1|jgi:poly(hydroxyalkanoate) depolymerase family esterase|uniref:Alpha/beta hydrolase family esterase n=1 Tax=Acidovorax facilis TaxID=12917 RepID=A0ABV8D5Q1_9BURK|nr:MULTISPECIES: PHB depolymerase family esterase [Acidovorax]KQB60180.1 phospholipase [Acidovorax sp. SD340]MBO1007332.1 PHB depolymerase family esterase [Acidovorax sp. SD340]MCO4243202.1 PHB depolymerase family esterase [Acidovorax facilis]